MILKLTGHDYKYAAEQIMLMLFPEEKPEYGERDPEKLFAEIRLSQNSSISVAVTKIITPEGKISRGQARISNAKLTDKIVTDRLLGRIVKLSFYKAATELTGKTPVWGALTGIRPGKLVTAMLEAGHSENFAVHAMMKDNFVSRERAELCLDTAKSGMKVQHSLAKNDICLYVGIPFCPTRCAYCSFVSNSVEKSMKLVEPFLDALDKEIDATAKIVSDRGLRVISVYMGGGTPTTLSAKQLDRLLGHLENAFDLSSVSEYTVEAGRPDTITAEKLRVLKKHDITRISINPQTMQDDVLNVIGRKHTADDIVKAVGLYKNSGISALNMDLIAGLPSDTPEGFYNTLEKVLALNPENITVHTLSLKKGTKITLEGTAIPDGEAVGKMLDYAAKRLRESGFAPYYLYRQKFMSGGFENVGWCKKGFDSLYNICIMEELCTIVSLGGGGSTKLVAPKSGRIERIFNPKYPLEFINGIDKVIEKKQDICRFLDENEADL